MGLPSLASKPLLITVAILSVTLIGSGVLVANLYKQLGAANGECVAAQLETSNERSNVTNDLATKSLRDRVKQLEAQLSANQHVEKAAQVRSDLGTKVLTEFRTQLDAARKTDPTLDAPIDTQRLRDLEASYRIRTQRSDSVRISRDSTQPVEKAL